MKETLEQALKIIAGNLGAGEIAFSVEHPKELSHGDYSTNLALVASKVLGKNPQEIAAEIKTQLEAASVPGVETVRIAGAGFVNITLQRDFFSQQIKEIIEHGERVGKNNSRNGQKVLIEYTQPNPFKPFHIGHLMSNAIGESLSRIIEWSGAIVIRANYQGDVGLHVAKALYGLQKQPIPESLKNASMGEQAAYIGTCYTFGAQQYEEDEAAKKEIEEINKKVYNRSDEEINKLYDWGKKITLEAFEELYVLLGTKFDYYFFESEMASIGLKTVQENTGAIFKESEGAIIFPAEKHNPALHTRVFITSAGLPTYETKELGLTRKKFELENPDLSITTTASEQKEYMQVVTEAIKLIYPDIATRMYHVSHGMMRFAAGKMSSRKGNVITGESLIVDATEAVTEKMKEREFSTQERKIISQMVGLAAVKYSILKQSAGSDIIFDFEKSISFEGDSGPYLQYSITRANSVLAKAVEHAISFQTDHATETVHTLERLLYRFPEVIARVQSELEPHHLVTFLTELASMFNAFYAEQQIVGNDSDHGYRLAITKAFSIIMKQGLWLLGINTPERM